MSNSVNPGDQQNNTNKEFLFRFQEENTCKVSSSFLEKHPECILNDFIQIDGEEEEDDGIYIDYTVHYPELLISIIEGESSDTPLDDTIDVSLLKNDFLALFPDRDGRTGIDVNTLSKPIFDYCSKSKDSICHCKTPVYSCAPTSDSDTYQNEIVDTMNFQDKYVYIVSGQLSDSKINELKQLRRYFSFFNFVAISIESTFTLDLDITTVINDQYLTIFPNLPSLHIRFLYYKKKDIDVHEVAFNYKEKEETHYIYKMNLYNMYNASFVKWILNNPYKDTIEEVIYNDSDAITQYMSIFKNNLYPSIKNIHFSYYIIRKQNMNSLKGTIKKLSVPTVECLSFENVPIGRYICERIPMIISYVNNTSFPNMKRISFQGGILFYINIPINISSIASFYESNVFTSCLKNTELFEEINLKVMPSSIEFKNLRFVQKVIENSSLPPVEKLFITRKRDWLFCRQSHNFTNNQEQWNSLSSLFNRLSTSLHELNIEENISANTIQDMIELFTPLTFTKLTNLKLIHNEPITFMPSLLLFLSSSSYPSLQSLTIQCESFNNQVPTENITLSFEDLKKQSIHLKMPCLKTLTFTKLYFNSESLLSTLTLFLTSCPSMEQLTFESCWFDNQCDNALLTVAKQGLMKHIQYIYFDCIQKEYNDDSEYTSFFIPRYFCNLEKGQLSSLNSLYFSKFKFTIDDFQSYVSLFTNHIIPSTCFSLTIPNKSYIPKIIIPSEGMNYLLDAIKDKKMTHLTTINLKYTSISLENLERFISYLNKEYLPNLKYFLISLDDNDKSVDYINPLIEHMELVECKQLCYKIFFSHYLKTIESKYDVPNNNNNFNNINDNDNNNNNNNFFFRKSNSQSRNTLNKTARVVTGTSAAPLGTIITDNKRNIDNTVNDNDDNSDNDNDDDDSSSEAVDMTEEKTNNDTNTSNPAVYNYGKKNKNKSKANNWNQGTRRRNNYWRYDSS
ncbi:hypothetical protein WA158_000310 [Blastocystis sp. Blastoise]